MYTTGITPTNTTYNNTTTYTSKTTPVAEKEQTTATPEKQEQQEGVVYKPGNTKADNAALVKQLKADLAHRKQQLQEMVEKMLNQQAGAWKTSNTGIDIYAVLRSGDFEADPDAIAQAKADVAEDGYWGVEQTSDRFLSFAKALTGGDSSKADEMLAAFKKGFEQATGAWGDKLPDLCQKTYEATLEKFEAWKNGTITE